MSVTTPKPKSCNKILVVPGSLAFEVAKIIATAASGIVYDLCFWQDSKNFRNGESRSTRGFIKVWSGNVGEEARAISVILEMAERGVMPLKLPVNYYFLADDLPGLHIGAHSTPRPRLYLIGGYKPEWNPNRQKEFLANIAHTIILGIIQDNGIVSAHRPQPVSA